MRVLFLSSSSIWVHTLPEGFRQAGHEVKVSGPLTEEKLSRFITQFNPDFALSVGWGQEQTPEAQVFILKCMRKSNLPHVYWSIEDPAFTQDFTIPLIKRMQPDFVFTQSASSVEVIRALGTPASYMDFGFAPNIHHYAPCDPPQRYGISIVANAYPSVLETQPDFYRRHSIHVLITPLLEQNIRVDFWGRDWDKAAAYVKHEIPKECLHGYLPYHEANRVYSTSKIILGLQNYPDQVTQRTYEIVASGGFLLTNDTPGVRSLFKPGKHVITSTSPEQTVDLVRYYFERPEECRKIAQKGQKHIADCSYKNRAEYMLQVLKQEKIL